jgi:hypothetical protein
MYIHPSVERTGRKNVQPNFDHGVTIIKDLVIAVINIHEVYTCVA